MKRWTLLTSALALTLALGAVPASRADNTFELTASSFNLTAGYMSDSTFDLNGGAFQFDSSVTSDTTYNLAGGFYCEADPILKLLTPLGTTVWQIGSTTDVTWWADVNAAGYNVRIELWRNNAKIMDLFGDYDPTGYKVHPTVVPNVIPGADYELRLVSAQLESFGHPNAAITTGPTLTIAIRNAVSPRSWALYQ